MKTIKFIPKKKYILAFMILGLFYFSSYAQDISDRLHFNVDWQMNAPLNTNFADKEVISLLHTGVWRLSLISIQIINMFRVKP